MVEVISSYGDAWPTGNYAFAIEKRPSNSAVANGFSSYIHGNAKTQLTLFNSEQMMVVTGDVLSVACTEGPTGVPGGTEGGAKGYTVTIKLVPMSGL